MWDEYESEQYYYEFCGPDTEDDEVLGCYSIDSEFNNRDDAWNRYYDDIYYSGRDKYSSRIEEGDERSIVVKETPTNIEKATRDELERRYNAKRAAALEKVRMRERVEASANRRRKYIDGNERTVSAAGYTGGTLNSSLNLVRRGKVGAAYTACSYSMTECHKNLRIRTYKYVSSGILMEVNTGQVFGCGRELNVADEVDYFEEVHHANACNLNEFYTGSKINTENSVLDKGPEKISSQKISGCSYEEHTKDFAQKSIYDKSNIIQDGVRIKINKEACNIEGNITVDIPMKEENKVKPAVIELIPMRFWLISFIAMLLALLIGASISAVVYSRMLSVREAEYNHKYGKILSMYKYPLKNHTKNMHKVRHTFNKYKNIGS
ncbi:hypothetical protein I6H07_06105 [Hafnia alvei]|nr:hypothetical protein [Hafnia alvei]MBI0275407.1 hypothetical protein [Hafnia alvei]PNK98599.1 hypothetical protein CEQ28_013895 [Hafnia alvei]